MVLVKLLGVLDFLVAIAIILTPLNIIPTYFHLVLAGYLVVKGIFFLTDITSYLDISFGLYMCLILYWNPVSVSVVIGCYLIIKALFSLGS